MEAPTSVVLPRQRPAASETARTRASCGPNANRSAAKHPVTWSSPEGVNPGPSPISPRTA